MSAPRAFLLLGMLCLSSPVIAETPVVLGAPESRILERPDQTTLVRIDEDVTLLFVETGDSEIAVRVSAIDRGGADIGVGRAILVAPSERRAVSLRSVFHEPQLQGVRLRLEALRGEGRVIVTASTSDGAHLIAVPQQDQPARRRPVRLRSTDALIDDALAAGAIGEETAILYRVYSLFSDSRLPEQYRGVDREATDSLYLIDVLSRLDSLSQETQELLFPFFTPPAYVGSWDDRGASGTTAQATPPPCQILADAWKFVDSPSGVVRVWYRYPDDALRASAIGSEVDTNIWPEFKNLLRRTPPTDQNVNCNGGSPALDIYMVDAIRVVGIPTSILGAALPYQGCSGNAPPKFLLIKRTAKNTTLAHEIFHAFQGAFQTVGCSTGANYRWWTEGSAMWSEDFIYKGAQDEHDYTDPLLNAPEKELDLEDGYVGCDHCYATYLLPFFVHRKTNSADFVRTTWENCSNQPALEAFDKAVGGGFKEVWPEFTLRNWNRDPMEDYRTWDGLSKVARSVDNGPELVRLQGSRDRVYPVSVNLPRVSAMYKHFDFRFDDSVRTVAFWNGLTNVLSKPDEFEIDLATQDQKKGAHIRALIKIRGQPQWKIEEWTDRNTVAFCRDRAAERIDELVLIISNSEFAERNRRLRHPGLTPLLWASNMGCYQWKGRSSALVGLDIAPGGIAIEADATFTSFGTSPPFIFYTATGTQNWRVTGNGCTGNGTLPIASGISFLMTHNFTPPGGTKYRGYAVAGLNQAQNVTIQCGSPPQSHTITLPPWIFSERIQPPLPEVEPDGKTIDDVRFPPPGQTGTYDWHFEARTDTSPP